MYDVFEKLLEPTGMKPSVFGSKVGIAPSTLSDWKRGKSTPKQDKMQIIADYFGVTVDYLMTGKEIKDEFSTYQEQAELFVKIRHDEKMLNALEKFYKLSDKQKEHIFELIDLLVEVSE